MRECIIARVTESGGKRHSRYQLFAEWRMEIEKKHILQIMPDKFAVVQFIESETDTRSNEYTSNNKYE